MRSDAVTLDDLAGGITTLKIACRRLNVATGQLGEALSQVRALTDQRSAPARLVALGNPVGAAASCKWSRARSMRGHHDCAGSNRTGHPKVSPALYDACRSDTTRLLQVTLAAARRKKLPFGLPNTI